MPHQMAVMAALKKAGLRIGSRGMWEYHGFTEVSGGDHPRVRFHTPRSFGKLTRFTEDQEKLMAKAIQTILDKGWEIDQGFGDASTDFGFHVLDANWLDQESARRMHRTGVMARNAKEEGKRLFAARSIQIKCPICGQTMVEKSYQRGVQTLFECPCGESEMAIYSSAIKKKLGVTN